MRSGLDPERRRALHGLLARALTARRRANALEVAVHLQAAGDLAAAWPTYVRAAKRAARDGRYSEVIEICRIAAGIEGAATAHAERSQTVASRRWLALLRGEALVARRAWAEAIPSLRSAVDAAREEGDRAGLARCLGALGRASFRQGALAEAAPLLREALAQAEPGAPDRASTVRALADIEQRQGNLDDADRLWHDALQASLDMGSRDAEARARRGLAHLRALQGRLTESGDLLARADDLLNPDGDYRVRAGVLTRAIELDAASGRLGSALYRAEVLVDLASRHGMGDRMPDAYALLAQIQGALGCPGAARDAARQAIRFADAHADDPWKARIRATRAYLDLGDPEAAAEALPRSSALPPDPIADPTGQLLAVRARLATDRSEVTRLATAALGRPDPVLVLSRAAIALDVAKALVAADHPTAAATAASRGLDALQGTSAEGLVLELLLTLHRARPAAHLVDAIRQAMDALTPMLPPRPPRPSSPAPICSGSSVPSRPGFREVGRCGRPRLGGPHPIRQEHHPDQAWRTPTTNPWRWVG